ncbi:MAG: M20/M25/M40 family metallo-hydrolase, partial [Spirochaetota bacterium]
MTETADLASLEPREVWELFFQICSIPHSSHHEEALAAWALERARGRGLAASRDAAGNVIIRKPARPGREGAPGVIIQAHLDMVPQKNSGSVHDFGKDPIRPRIDPADPAWLCATGTTLGADNGVGVAAGLALLDDPDLDHGPLELLLTVNEEDGMTGARAVVPGSLRGKILLNFDGELEEELGVGSAGTQRLYFDFVEDAPLPPLGLEWFTLSVAGLLGGHSGGDITLGRGNSLGLLAGLLAPESGGEARLATIAGGSLPNAIPRESLALFGVPAATAMAFRSRFEARAREACRGFAAVEPGLLVALEEAEPPRAALSAEASSTLLTALSTMPNGLCSLLEGSLGVARLSSNLGALETRMEAASAVCPPAGPARGPNQGVCPHKIRVSGKILVRGAFDAERDALTAEIRACLEAHRVSVTTGPSGPAWSPDPTSALLSLAKEVWAEFQGGEVQARATHGGLECNHFKTIFPDWELLSIGPTIRFPHSPDEAVEIASVGRFMARARRLVERLATFSAATTVAATTVAATTVAAT